MFHFLKYSFLVFREGLFPKIAPLSLFFKQVKFSYMSLLAHTYTYNQCKINDRIVDYDVCHEGDLEYAKAAYHEYEYIGSGFITYHNGTENNWEKERHFFIRK